MDIKCEMKVKKAILIFMNHIIIIEIEQRKII